MGFLDGLLKKVISGQSDAGGIGGLASTVSKNPQLVAALAGFRGGLAPRRAAAGSDRLPHPGREGARDERLGGFTDFVPLRVEAVSDSEGVESLSASERRCQPGSPAHPVGRAAGPVKRQHEIE